MSGSTKSPTVRISPTPNAIKREGASRRIDVGANVAGRDLGAVVRDVEAALARIDFPLGYHPELLGEYEERQAAQDRLLLFAIAAADRHLPAAAGRLRRAGGWPSSRS